jgi:hypothetical protein
LFEASSQAKASFGMNGTSFLNFKTIADFRKDNGAAIRAVCSQFVVLCRELALFTRAVVAIVKPTAHHRSALSSRPERHPEVGQQSDPSAGLPDPAT